eukprot:GILJ01008543.1.p1 GENE.GILJ01008543.1~~GILJ01008543.1.p1  ORF type:complete len:684 (-),score=90.50 GILJ01008543.1:485-2536(-)
MPSRAEDHNTPLSRGNVRVVIDEAEQDYERMQTTSSYEAVSRNPSLASSSSSTSLNESRASHPKAVTVTFKNIKYAATVKPSVFKKSFKKEILHGVSGYCCSGQFLAMLGPSGAGKSTLLNVLGNRYTKGIEGEVLLNGAPLDKGHRAVIGFVRQEDLHFASLTVREILSFSVRLRCGYLSHAEQRARVERVMEELALTKSANTAFGNAMRYGLSGGERKRLSIGVELVTDPPLLLMDEPTSGLDSHLSWVLVNELNRLKRGREDGGAARTLIATIHQPSTEVFMQFDLVMILSEGHVVFFGSPQSAMEYFTSSIGIKFRMHGNPADEMLDLASLHLNKGEETAKKFPVLEINKDVPNLTWNRLIDEWKTHEPEVIRDAESAPKGAVIDLGNEAYTKRRAPYFTQFRLLALRAFYLFFRDLAQFRARVIQGIFMGIVVGFVFFRLGFEQIDLRGRQGALFFIVMNQSVSPMFNALHLFAEERKVVLNERAAKWYQVSPYVLGKIFSEFPLQILEPILLTIIIWYIANVNASFVRFLGVVSALILSHLAGNSVGLFLAAVTPSVNVSIIFGGIVLLVLILFSGFFVPLEVIPGVLRWLQWVSFLRYSFELALGYVFEGQTYTCAPQEFVGTECPIETGEEFLAASGIDNVNYALDYSILVAIMVGFRVATYFAVRFYKPRSLRV